MKKITLHMYKHGRRFDLRPGDYEELGGIGVLCDQNMLWPTSLAHHPDTVKVQLLPLSKATRTKIEKDSQFTVKFRIVSGPHRGYVGYLGRINNEGSV